jgi:RNA polymerase sigma-70 factor, ECF subfamily
MSHSDFIAELYRTESRRVLATLPRDGVPENPRAWLVSTGRFKAIDRLRRHQRFDDAKEELARRFEEVAEANTNSRDDEIEDDRLRLIFTCCHPAIAPDAQVPLTLREVCGLKTEEIASAFLSTPSTIAQRIVRAKSKIRDAGIPFVVPSAADFAERLEGVLAVIYLVFNEGYSASSGDSVTRADLSGEAIRLGRLLVELLPDSEAMGLLALMLLQESRRLTRVDASGDIVLLEDQDRSRWDREYINEGLRLIFRVMSSRRVGAYSLQAAIAAEHARAPAAAATDWRQIVALYDALLAINPSPVIELNRAVAVAMRDGPEAGLTLVNDLLSMDELAEYHLAYASKAELLRRAGRYAESVTAYEEALRLARQEPEICYLSRRLEETRRQQP